MAPTTAEVKGPHEDFNLKKEISWCLDEEIVISGISGRFPEADNVEEFKQKLYDGVDLVTENERRWPAGLFGLPKRAGTIKDISRFDAQNFGINAKMAHEMDPQMRMLVEATQEAIFDAGINPSSLRGSRTGVFLGSSAQDAYTYWSEQEDRVHGYGMLGGSMAMIANRISFTFDFKGPSYTLDSSCSSSMFALQQGLAAIRTGVVDNAVVCAGNIVVLPTKGLLLKKINLLPTDGESKPFDNETDGFERSEAVVVCFLQKRKSAKRIYATVLSAVANSDGNKEEGFTNVCYKSQVDTLTQALKEANVKPEDIEYVETHAMGTKIGDSTEANAVAEVFCKNRKEPLLVGSVKSNMGHAEAASGLCSLVKVLLAMETGVIAPNIHFDNPNKFVPALFNSELKVVTEPTPYKGGVAVVNSIGLAGTNGTVLLRSNPTAKTIPEENKKKFRLICVSGRNNAAVEATLDKVVAHKDDEEFLSLINDVYGKNIAGYDFKGYAVVTDNVTKEVQSAGDSNRPIWYVFAGMGSQWAGMARDLIKIPVCEKVIRKLHEVLLRTENYNLLSVLLSEDESTFDNILNSLTCIAVVQVALVDFLESIGITPEGMIGHSAGEVGCAYADGTLTAEEAVFTAYYRGRSILEANLDLGAMAAIGLTWEETKKRVPEGVYAACHNSDDSVTISGPPDKIKAFVDQLKSEGVFAREVKSSGCAFHSKYVSKAGPIYKKYLEKAIKNPKLRTSRWLSTSNAESQWNTPTAQYSGPDYHVNNLLNPVLFQETFKFFPENAIVIEVAPHHLMQAVVKRALGPKTTVLGLIKRLHKNNLEFLLSNIGKFYIAGGQPNLNNLLSNQQYPVARGTAMIQSVVEWDHSSEWSVPDFSDMALQRTGVCDVLVDLTTEEYSYINGHVVDGRIVLPGVGFVEIAWKVFSKLHGQPHTEFSVVLENVQFFRATILPENGSVTFTVSYLAGANSIEISEGSAIIMRANIRKANDFDDERIQNLPPAPEDKSDALILSKKSDIYKFFVMLGFTYYGDFLGIRKIDESGYYSELEFHGHYAPFMDTIIQAGVYTLDAKVLHLPVGLGRVLINPKVHKTIADAAPRNEDGVPYIPIRYFKDIDVLITGGIEIRGVSLNMAPAKSFTQQPSLEKHVFIPYVAEQEFSDVSSEQLVKLFTDIVTENNPGAYELKVIEYAYDRDAKKLYALKISQAIESIPLNKIEADVTVITNTPEDVNPSFAQNRIQISNKDASTGPFEVSYNFIVAENVASDSKLLTNFLDALLPGGFLLAREKIGADCAADFEKLGFQLVSNVSNSEQQFYFLKKPSLPNSSKYIYIDESYKWLDDLKSALSQSKETGLKVVLVGEKQPTLGLLGLFNCIKREPGNVNVRCVFLQDPNAPAFSENEPFFAEQLKKDLSVNVYKDGQWGSYRHIAIPHHKDNKIVTPYAFAGTTQRGDVSTIQWIQDAPPSFKVQEYEDKKLCYVYYSPVTENDVLLASLKGSKYPSYQGITSKVEYIGMEFSGKDENGKKVMGLVGDKALATTVFADPQFTWDVPEDWSLEQACTVPLPYSVAYYALYICGKIKSTDSILIHEAGTSLAQAAISICLNLGCKLYVTGSSHILIYLKSVYPQISDESLIEIDGTALDYVLIKRTKGKGVNLVLNSNGDHKIRQYFRVLNRNGKFLDTRKIEERNLTYEHDFMKHNITYYSIYPESFFEPKAEKELKVKVANLVKEGLANGSVVPSLTTPFTELEKAVSFVNEDNYIGKVVIEVKEEEFDESEEAAGPAEVTALRRSYFNPNKSYIVLGGLGGFGMELALFMADRYARNIVLVSRSGVTTMAHKVLITNLKKEGINVFVSKADASTYKGAEQLIKEAASLAPVGGIFNLAAVLNDSIFENLTEKEFEVVSKPKVQTTRYLDEVSRKLCPELESFVTFSSVSCGRGNAGQTNYGLANSTMDRICEARRRDGLPALSIQWGAIGDVGMVLEKLLVSNNQEVGGILPQRLFSCLSTLEYLIQLEEPVVSTVVLAEKVKAASSAQLQPADVVAAILGIKDVDSVNKTATLVELGTDSLTNVEIKQTLERKFGIIINAQDVLQLTFEKIAELSAGSSS